MSLQVTLMWDGLRLFSGWLNICLPRGSGEWIPGFALLVNEAFPLPIKLSSSQLTSFLLLLFQISQKSHQRGVGEQGLGADWYMLSFPFGKARSSSRSISNISFLGNLSTGFSRCKKEVVQARHVPPQCQGNHLQIHSAEQ